MIQIFVHDSGENLLQDAVNRIALEGFRYQDDQEADDESETQGRLPTIPEVDSDEEASIVVLHTSFTTAATTRLSWKQEGHYQLMRNLSW